MAAIETAPIVARSEWDRDGGSRMEIAWTTLAEERVHALPVSEDEAKAALEWIADREGKTLVQLVEELHARVLHAPGSRVLGDGSGHIPAA